MPLGGADLLPQERFAALLSEARERTLALVEPVCERDMDRVHDPLMSPLVWDLGHIAAFEELWLCRRAGGMEGLRQDLWSIYDATETPRADRADLPYLTCHEAREYLAEVRERTLWVLERVDLSPDGDRLNAGGLVWEMIVQHEQQHNETMLQTLALAEAGVYCPEPRPLPRSWRGGGRDMVRIDAGPFLLGIEADGFAYDNEGPQHGLDLPAFEIDRTPVTNGAYLEFVDAGGYAQRECWSDAGWAWRERERVERPLYWTEDGRVRWFHRVLPLDPRLPVMHVCWHEAEAYARWRGKRLPTEPEWEKAAAWDEQEGRHRRFPWGDEPPTVERANLDQLAFGPAAAGAYAAGASAYGVLGLVGDCWEWTASHFEAYPGFRAFPYREYSEIFFGDTYKVLRGGSWATRPRVIRTSFRNWDYPERRQIFSGFRCACDA